MSQFFEDSLAKLRKEHDALIRLKNTKTSSNGVWTRYAYPVVTAGHTPLFWRYDLNPATNPRLLERFGINSAFNSGAIKLGGKYILVVRVEGSDRKSFFAVAESDNGVDNFRFWPHPVTIPEETATNVYDMRLTAHEDGWIYGVFCAECHDPAAAMKGFTPDGGMIYEYDPATGRRDSDRHWWVQAETVVGCINQYQKTGEAHWLESAESEWSFIRRHIITPDGEWYWSLRSDGTPNTIDDRAGFWKCPYHNGRMCLEVLERGLCSMR